MNEPTAGLYAAISCGYIQPAQWIRWAGGEIIERPSPPMWLIDLSLAKDSQAALTAIRESIIEAETLPVAEIDEITLGLIACKDFENRATFEEFLQEAGDHAESSSCSTDCEYFYGFLNRWEESESADQFEASAAAEIREDLAGALEHVERTRSQLAPITEQPPGFR